MSLPAIKLIVTHAVMHYILTLPRGCNSLDVFQLKQPPCFAWRLHSFDAVTKLYHHLHKQKCSPPSLSGQLSSFCSWIHDILIFAMLSAQPQSIIISLFRCRCRCPAPSASPTVSTRRCSRWCCPSCLTLPSATRRSQRRRAASI